MNKKILINSFIIIFALFCIIFGIVFAFNKNYAKDENLTSKAEEEIKYLEDKIILMMNKLNKISFSDTIMIEKQTQSNNQNSQTSKDTSKSNNSEGEGEEGGSSKNLSSGSSEGSTGSESEGSNTTKETTKYEVKENSILLNANQDIDWDYIKSNTETIYSTWPTIVVDLHELNVKNEDILNFSNVLDQVTLSVKNEDKTTTLNNLASLYAFFPNYRSQISDDNKNINIDYTKNCLLNSYALVEQDKWEEIGVQLTNAMNYFSNVMNSIDGNGQTQNRISKVYVLLNELNSSVNIKDKELFYIKYRNVMEEVTNL